jgi:hypothetical protein
MKADEASITAVVHVVPVIPRLCILPRVLNAIREIRVVKAAVEGDMIR